MKKSNKVLVGSLAIAMIGVFTVSSVMAYQGDYSKKGPEYSPERHSAIREAMNSNDYETWSKLMANRGRITQVINEENFAQFAKAHELAHNGDLEGADAIRQELKIRTGNGEKIGAGYHKRQDRNKDIKQRDNKMNSENRGQNQGERFTDTNNDEICDNL